MRPSVHGWAPLERGSFHRSMVPMPCPRSWARRVSCRGSRTEHGSTAPALRKHRAARPVAKRQQVKQRAAARRADPQSAAPRRADPQSEAAPRREAEWTAPARATAEALGFPCSASRARLHVASTRWSQEGGAAAPLPHAAAEARSASRGATRPRARREALPSSTRGARPQPSPSIMPGRRLAPKPDRQRVVVTAPRTRFACAPS